MHNLLRSDLCPEATSHRKVRPELECRIVAFSLTQACQLWGLGQVPLASFHSSEMATMGSSWSRRKLFSEADEMRRGKAMGSSTELFKFAASLLLPQGSSCGLCQGPTCPTRPISWPGEVSSRGLGPWVVHGEEPGLLCCGTCPQGLDRTSLACRHSCSSLSSKGWTDTDGNPAQMCQDPERGWAMARRRGCPNRTQSGLSPAWCHPLLVIALIDTRLGCGENFVEGGECRGFVLLASRAGFEPQWRESCKRFYF